MHHKYGQIKLHNIHDQGNLVALCSICHFAFDSDEWAFIPEEMTEWIQEITTTPKIIQELNTRRNVVYRRLLLAPDPDSRAFNDEHYRSAFTNNPTKIWSGEPGVLITRPLPRSPPVLDKEARQFFADLSTLHILWTGFESTCLEENCPICQNKSDDDAGDDDDDAGDDDDDDDAGDDDDDDDDGNYDGNDDGDSDWNEENSEEDDQEGCKKDVSSSRKSKKVLAKKQPMNAGQQSPLKDVSNHRKNFGNTETERDWMNSAPYDESVPYSHRYGYTWAGTTSNQLMELWQLNRKPVDNSSSLHGYGKEV